MNQLDQVESVYLRQNVPDFRAGDTLRVHVRVVVPDQQQVAGIRNSGDRG